MREPLKDKTRLDHIVQAINKVFSFTEDIALDDLNVGDMRYYAVVKNIEIIGEAAYMLSADFKQEHPDTDWISITAMRHNLVHGYYHVSAEEVWEVVRQDLLPLRGQVLSYLSVELVSGG